VEGILEGNPNPEVEPKGDTSIKPGFFCTPAEPLPQMTNSRANKRRAEHSPEMEGVQVEQQPETDVPPITPVASDGEDSDGEAVSIPDSPPSDRTRTPRQSPLAVKLAAAININRTAEDLFGANYVQPVADDQVNVVDQSGWGIHYHRPLRATSMNQLSLF